MSRRRFSPASLQGMGEVRVGRYYWRRLTMGDGAGPPLGACGMTSGLDQEKLARLAEALACAHIGVPLNTTKRWRDRTEEATQVLIKDKEFAYLPTRVVVVVGSGASCAAYKLPTGKEAAEEVEAEMRKKDRSRYELFQGHHERLTKVYRLPGDDFETKLMAWSDAFGSDDARDFIADRFSHRYVPCLTYELIAHLFNHRFISTIINFNFDELLDQALDDELGRSRYNRIISGAGFYDDSTSDIPTCIKPHGTASERSSLRFTREDYFRISTPMKELLGSQFTPDGRVVILAIGTSMQSFEFNEIVETSKCEDLQLYAISRSDPRFAESKVLGDAYKHGGLLTADDNCPIDKVMLALWKRCCNLFNEGFGPRSARRHELVASLFNRPIARRSSDNDKAREAREQVDFLKDRALVELALAIAKAKCVVDVRQIASGRPGSYFRLYRLRSGAAHEQRLIDKEAAEQAHSNVLKYCNQLGLKSASYSHEDVRTTEKDPKTGEDRPVESAVHPKAFKVDELTKAVVSRLSRRTKRSLDGNNQLGKALTATLVEMCEQEEVEIDYSHVVAPDPVFAQAHAITSFTELRLETLELLRLRSLDALLCVAESGQWLQQLFVKEELLKPDKSPNPIALIVADPKGWTDEIKAFKKNVLVRQRDWWLHNRHMTVALRKGTPQRGIYFERRLRSSTIRPLLVTDQEELDILVQVFCVYWIKSRDVGANAVQSTRVPIDDRRYSPEEAAKLVEPLMNELYQARLRD
ncbi:MAG: SIR2 family protein [Gemmatimonadaceae bacterium]